MVTTKLKLKDSIMRGIHNHEDHKALIHRFSRVVGHLEAVKKMVEEGKECSDILIQLSAVKSALNGIGKKILTEHINLCMYDAYKSNDKKAIDDLNEAINKFIK